MSVARSSRRAAAAAAVAVLLDCKTAIDHGMELSAPMMSKMPNYAATKDKLRDLGIQHCTDDKWPADAVKCMVDAKSMEAGQGCYGKLSKEQGDSMNKAAAAVMVFAAAQAGLRGRLQRWPGWWLRLSSASGDAHG